MLGPAELNEFHEAASQADGEAAQNERRQPYLSAHFAMGKAMTRMMTGSLKRAVGLDGDL